TFWDYGGRQLPPAGRHLRGRWNTAGPGVHASVARSRSWRSECVGHAEGRTVIPTRPATLAAGRFETLGPLCPGRVWRRLRHPEHRGVLVLPALQNGTGHDRCHFLRSEPACRRVGFGRSRGGPAHWTGEHHG